MQCRVVTSYRKTSNIRPRRLIETRRLLEIRRLLEHWPRAPVFINVVCFNVPCLCYFYS